MPAPIRHITEADFDESDRVIQAAFGRLTSFRPMLALHRAMQSDGLWMATHDDQVLGTVSCVDYGQVAYVGLMTVRPDCRGQGIARSLMTVVLQWLDERGCGCTLLDATDLGAPLYERLGFVDDGFAYAYLEATGAKTATTRPSERGLALPQIRGAASDDLPAIIEVDRLAFGAERTKLLAALWQLNTAHWLIAVDGRGTVCGYIVERDPILGPWAAADVSVARALLVEALGRPRSQPALVHVPRSNEACRQAFSRPCIVEQRRLRHMRRGGDAPPGQRAMLFGQSSFGHG